MKNNSILKCSFVAVFAAIICIGSFLKIPLGPIPIVLQNILCLLTASLLGGIWGLFPTLIFFVAGLIGLPFYSGGTAGISVLLGPTGGFLIGYLFGSLITSLISRKPSLIEKTFSLKKIFLLAFSFTCGILVIYFFGVLHFLYWSKLNNLLPLNQSPFVYAITICLLPFLPGDILKIILATFIASKIRPIVATYLNSSY